MHVRKLASQRNPCDAVESMMDRTTLVSRGVLLQLRAIAITAGKRSVLIAVQRTGGQPEELLRNLAHVPRSRPAEL